MDPAQLPAGVTAADGHLVDRRAIADARLDPRPDGVDVGSRLEQAHGDPRSHRLRTGGVAAAGVPPHRHRRGPVDHHEIEQAVEVEIDEGGATCTVVADDPGVLGALGERAVGLADEQVAGVARGVSLLGLDVALGDEQVREAVVVDVGELGVPGRRRQHVAAGERSVGGGAALEGDVLVGRAGRPVGEGLQLVVALARQEHLGSAVTREVGAGDAHAPDPQWPPPVGLGVESRRLTGGDSPQLIAAVAGVVAIVRHPQVALPGSGPVAEQHRESAVAGGQGDRCGVPAAVRRGPEQPAVLARLAVGREVVPERQRGQVAGPLPRGAEGDRPRVGIVETERLVGPLEAAATEAAQDDVLADPQHGEVDVSVAVDVERVGTGDPCQVGDRRGQWR